MKLFHSLIDSNFIPNIFLQKFECVRAEFSLNPFSKMLSPDSATRKSTLHAKDGTFLPIAFSLDEAFSDSYRIKNIHSNKVIDVSEEILQADSHIIAGYKYELIQLKKKFLAIETADCLPVVFYYEDERIFIGGIAHAGWRGLTAGIIKNTFMRLKEKSILFKIDSDIFIQGLKVFIAPAIFGLSYECGKDVEESLSKYKLTLFKDKESKHNFGSVFDICANVKLALELTAEIDKFALQHQVTFRSTYSIFPDIQLLAAIECCVLGVSSSHISIFRENTYGHSILPSFREKSHAFFSVPMKRLNTYLCLPNKL